MDLDLFHLSDINNVTNINYSSVLLMMESTFWNMTNHYVSSDIIELLEFQYYTWGITGNIISVLGLIGNLLSIVVLGNQRMMSSISCYLIALAIFDSIVLISLVLFLALPTMYLARQMLEGYFKFYPYMHQYAYSTALISQTCSIYTTVAFTIERYIAVCKPRKAPKMCIIARAQKMILLIVVCSTVYNIPRMLEYKVVEEIDPITNMTSAMYVPTGLGANTLFRHVYFIYMHIVVMLVVPVTTLAVLNTLLIITLQRSKATQSKTNNKALRRENSLTMMLIAVIVGFLVFEFPSILDNVFQATLDDDILMSSPFVKLTTISSLMVIINSASNFYLYCLFGQKFRHVLCRIITLQYFKTTRQFTRIQRSIYTGHTSETHF